MAKLSFASDYQEGAQDTILSRLQENNYRKMAGYGTDLLTESARDKIREACRSPNADIYFLTGGTQTNATVIDALLRPYEGVLAAISGHIYTHEAGAIEFGGHKILLLPECQGKVSAEDIRETVEQYEADGNRDHMVKPGMVYISQPTELGALYSLSELRDISRVCRKKRLSLYVDGARLAYALACPENDVTLPDLAALCDVFYIGGTKCGALFGEAVVIPQKGYIPYFPTIMKQHGGLLAKGWLLGLQFDTLFTDGLYQKIGKTAIQAADRIRQALQEYGYRSIYENPTNQVFPLLENQKMVSLAESVDFCYWEKYDYEETIIRLTASWATTDTEVDQLIDILQKIR